MDKIKVYYKAGETLTAVIQKNAAEIMSEVLAVELCGGDSGGAAFVKDWDINGENAVLAVELI